MLRLINYHQITYEKKGNNNLTLLWFVLLVYDSYNIYNSMKQKEQAIYT